MKNHLFIPMITMALLCHLTTIAQKATTDDPTPTHDYDVKIEIIELYYNPRNFVEPSKCPDEIDIIAKVTNVGKKTITNVPIAGYYKKGNAWMGRLDLGRSQGYVRKNLSIGRPTYETYNLPKFIPEKYRYLGIDNCEIVDYGKKHILNLVSLSPNESHKFVIEGIPFEHSDSRSNKNIYTYGIHLYGQLVIDCDLVYDQNLQNHSAKKSYWKLCPYDYKPLDDGYVDEPIADQNSEKTSDEAKVETPASPKETDQENTSSDGESHKTSVQTPVIYPNPVASGQALTIATEQPAASLSIINLATGQTVETEQTWADPHKLTISTSDWKSGIYVIITLDLAGNELSQTRVTVE